MSEYDVTFGPTQPRAATSVQLRPVQRWIREPLSPVELSVQLSSIRPPVTALPARFVGAANVVVEVEPDPAVGGSELPSRPGVTLAVAE